MNTRTLVAATPALHYGQPQRELRRLTERDVTGDSTAGSTGSTAPNANFTC